MAFDPDAYLKGGTTAPAPAGQSAGFNPDAYLASPSSLRGTMPDTATGTDHWHNLYAGLDGLDNRINEDQKRAFASLDTNSPQDPKEARAGVINQVYLQSKMPQLTPQFIANNLQTVTDSYAEHALGIKGSGMTQATLYGKISEQMKKEQEVSAETGWGHASTGLKLELMLRSVFPKRDAAEAWSDLNQPAFKLPEWKNAPDLPQHMFNPAIYAGVWNSVFKPVLEGVESPVGVATLGIGSTLGAAAKAGSAPARVALASMSGLFSGLFIKSAVKGAPETMRVLNDPASTTQQKAEAVGGTFRDSVLGILGAVGVAESLKPGTAKLIEKQSPAQAADTLKTEALAEKNPEVAQALTNAAEHLEEVSPEKLSQATVTEQPAPTSESEPAAAATPDLNKATVTSTDSGFVVTDGNGQLIDYAKTAAEARKIADAHDAALPPFLRGGQTSLKNATAELERAGYDLPESTPTQTRVMAASWDRAKAVLEKNEKAGEELTKRLVADPNLGLTDDQSALLLRHKVGIENALNAAVAEANSPDTPIEERPAAAARATELSGQLTEFLDAVKRRGSEWGREGRWRQAMAKEDFSFATQEQLLKASKGGKPLTEAERTRLVEKIDQMKAKQRQLEKHVEQLTKESAGTTSTDKNVVSQFIDKQADAARARIRLRAAGGIMYSGLPLDVLGDYAIIGAQHIKNGAVKFADWSAKMVKEFGEKIEPHLRDIFEEAKNKQVKTQDQISAELGDLKSKMQEALSKEAAGEPSGLPDDGPRRLTDEQRLAAFKNRTQARILELEQKLAAGDFSPKPKREAVALDEQGLKLKAQLERIKQDFAIERAKAQEEAKSPAQKLLSKTADLARASALSGYHTLAKLATFSLARFAEAPALEAVGAAVRQIPGMEAISAKANLEAGSEARALARFYTKAATMGGKDAWETLLTGKSDLKAEVGNATETGQPIHWYDYFGISHAAEKAPLFRGAFEMALAKNTAHAIANGLDVTDGMVQAALRKEAGDYANRAILQENNMFSEWLNSLTNRMEAVNPKTKQVDLEKAALSTFIKTFLTKGIVKTPSNYIMQTLERTPLGLVRGGVGAVVAHARGIEKLTPAEANTISRLLKVGAVGSAMFIWGAIDATKDEKDRVFGGYYTPGPKRGKEDVSFGKIRVDGMELPHLATHNPLTEAAQMGSTMVRVALSKLSKKDKENKGALAGAFAAVLALASQAPIVSPITRTAQSVESGHANKVAYDAVAGLVPQLVQNIAQDTDPEKSRAPRDLPEAVKATIPVLREEVPATKKH